MALSTVFLASSSLCFPQTPNRPLGVQRPHSVLPQTTSSSWSKLPRAQERGIFQYQPLKSTNRRSLGTVKTRASPDDEGVRYTKNVEVFSEEHLLDTLAHDILELYQECIRAKDYFSFAIADTTSVKFLSKLVSSENIKKIDWAKCQFFWVEEEVIVPGVNLKRRYLPDELLHRLVYNQFLNKVKEVGPLNVVTIDYELTAQQEASDHYEKILRDMVARNKIGRSRRGLPKFDLMLLGMEKDGTVGSLIPNHPVLREQERWVTHVQYNEDTRLNLTLPVINASSNIAMVVSGTARANAVYDSLMDIEVSDRDWPAKHISPEEGGVMKWYLDKDAASRIFKEELRIDQRLD